MTRARDLSNDEANGGGATPPFVAGKNSFINGGFDIWQRGTTITAGVYNYLADRWLADHVNTAYSAQINLVHSKVFEDHSNSVNFATTGSGDALGHLVIEQRLETPYHLSGKTVTLSFEAKAMTALTGACVIKGIAQSSISGSIRDVTTLATIIPDTSTIPSGSYQRYTATFAVPTLTDGQHFRIGIHFANLNKASNTGNVLRLRKVQLELGSVATPFTLAGGGFPGTELALCQRYYWRTTGGSGYQPVCNGFASSTTNVMGYVQYPVTMRATPTAIEYSTLQCNDSTTGTAVSAVAFSGTEVGPSAATLNFTCSSMTTFRPTKVLQSNSASGYLALSAEM